jgi:chemotaxis protein histidine kinase CheA
MEHVAHAGHEGGNTGRYIGITMALLGVMLAFCSALVGSARTELIKTMVEQQTAHSKYQAQAMKYRMVVSQLQALSASLPNEAEQKAAEAELDKLQREATKAADAPPPKDADKGAPKAADAAKAAPKESSGSEAALLVTSLRMTTKQLAQLIVPHKSDVLHFTHLVRKYRAERDVASEWAESFEGAIHAHTEASEHYEWGQLCSEIGIVIASIALLFSSRKVWAVSLVLGALCAGIIGWTYSATHAEIHHAELSIAENSKKYHDLRKSQDEREEDEKLVTNVEASFGEHTPAPAPAPHSAPSHH